jgi:hypothetical protein
MSPRVRLAGLRRRWGDDGIAGKEAMADAARVMAVQPRLPVGRDVRLELPQERVELLCVDRAVRGLDVEKLLHQLVPGPQALLCRI